MTHKPGQTPAIKKTFKIFWFRNTQYFEIFAKYCRGPVWLNCRLICWSTSKLAGLPMPLFIPLPGVPIKPASFAARRICGGIRLQQKRGWSDNLFGAMHREGNLTGSWGGRGSPFWNCSQRCMATQNSSVFNLPVKRSIIAAWIWLIFQKHKKHDTDHLCQYRRDSKPRQGFAGQGQFPGEGSWLARQPTALSWFYTSGWLYLHQRILLGFVISLKLSHVTSARL